MIGSFIDSWALFHNTYFVGWSIALMLSALGVVVAARDQIFIGAAISQASLFGIALGMVLSGSLLSACVWCQSDHFPSLVGGGCAIVGALLTTQAGRTRGRSYEATTGWVFLFASSAAILLVARSPHGLEEVHRLLSSTIIGATHHDVEIFAALALVTLAGLALANRTIRLLVMDKEMAAAVGIAVARWDRFLSIWLGLGVGLSIRIAGMLYSFGMLVLPALLARELCREVRTMFIVSPILALLGSSAAFVLANHYDLPPGQVAVALLAAALAGVWLSRSAAQRFRLIPRSSSSFPKRG